MAQPLPTQEFHSYLSLSVVQVSGSTHEIVHKNWTTQMLPKKSNAGLSWNPHIFLSYEYYTSTQQVHHPPCPACCPGPSTHRRAPTAPYTGHDYEYDYATPATKHLVLHPAQVLPLVEGHQQLHTPDMTMSMIMPHQPQRTLSCMLPRSFHS
jgi:hypothetical protein